MATDNVDSLRHHREENIVYDDDYVSDNNNDDVDEQLNMHKDGAKDKCQSAKTHDVRHGVTGYDIALCDMELNGGTGRDGTWHKTA